VSEQTAGSDIAEFGSLTWKHISQMIVYQSEHTDNMLMNQSEESVYFKGETSFFYVASNPPNAIHLKVAASPSDEPDYLCGPLVAYSHIHPHGTGSTCDSW
jgi:hypothetical protein